MKGALEALNARGGTPEVLPNSWRSRPSVLRYLNAVFCEAFRRDGMPRELIELEPERLEIPDTAAVMRWTLPRTRKVAEQADALATAISELQQSGTLVFDPETKKSRAIAFGDIAVLARTNKNVQVLAKALRARRVPMKMTLAGLLETPECALREPVSAA